MSDDGTVQSCKQGQTEKQFDWVLRGQSKKKKNIYIYIYTHTHIYKYTHTHLHHTTYLQPVQKKIMSMGAGNTDTIKHCGQKLPTCNDRIIGFMLKLFRSFEKMGFWQYEAVNTFQEQSGSKE
jgi:hypothetical protein